MFVCRYVNLKFELDVKGKVVNVSFLPQWDFLRDMGCGNWTCKLSPPCSDQVKYKINYIKYISSEICALTNRHISPPGGILF